MSAIVADVASHIHVCLHRWTDGATPQTGMRAFSVAVVSAWNSLTDYLHDPAVGLSSFRRQLHFPFEYY